jgi:hypothetical protein
LPPASNPIANWIRLPVKNAATSWAAAVGMPVGVNQTAAAARAAAVVLRIVIMIAWLSG